MSAAIAGPLGAQYPAADGFIPVLAGHVFEIKTLAIATPHGRHSEAERLCCIEVDHKLELWLLDRNNLPSPIFSNSSVSRFDVLDCLEDF